MSNYERAKHYYEAGYWTIAMLRAVTAKGYITPAEFKEITGQDYEADNDGNN